MKKWFKYFVYFSFFFLIFSLAKADYLVIPFIYSYVFLFISVALVCIGFLFDAFSWHKALQSYGYGEVRFSDSISSMGLSVFGKYVPGKIWLIIGRSAFIANKYDLSEKDTAVISLNAQFVSLWIGLLLGIFGLLFVKHGYYLTELAILIWFFITVLIFSRLFHDILMHLIKTTFGKKINIPALNARGVIKALPWFFMSWLCWCAGFYYLANSLGSEVVAPFTGLGFALAGTLGLLAIISPGGLGVREGILVTFLIMAGFDEKFSITISVSSRLWFLIGEVFIFLCALFLMKFGRSG